MREIIVVAKTQVKNKIDEKGDVLYVGVRAAPKGGKANIAIITLLADYFSVPEKCITLIHGRTSPKKVFTIADH